MNWTQQKLAHYIGRVRTVVEFEGITGEELAHAFEGEAMRRLTCIQQIIYNEYQTDQEKIQEILQYITD